MNARKAVNMVLVAAAITLVTACSTTRGFPDPPKTSTVIFPEVDYQLATAAIKNYNEEIDLAKKKLLRNEIIDARLAELDIKFGDYERAIYSEGVGYGVGTDWFVLSLTAATVLAHAAGAKTALGAVSTAVVGGEAAFDKRVLFEKTLPALMAQMVAERETVRAAIRTNEELPVESYTWSAAESQLEQYKFAGSIPGAIAAVAQDAGKKTDSAKQQLQDVRKSAYFKTAAGDLLMAFWMPDGTTINAANEAKLKQWITDNSIATGAGEITML